MNKIIEEQLAKCKVADLSHFDIDTNTYHIPKFKQIKMEINSCYVIKLNDALLNKDSSIMLVTNWNKGSVPPCKYFKIDVSKILGKMIYVNGLGYDYDNQKDLNIMWTGWLPLQDIEVLERI